MKRIRKVVEGDKTPYYQLEFKEWWWLKWDVVNTDYKLCKIATKYMDYKGN